MLARIFLAFALIAGLSAPAYASYQDKDDALLLGEQALRDGDYKAALRTIRPLANEDFARAQYVLGAMYYSGLGVDQDLVAAHAWFERAALQGDEWARAALGGMYKNGTGVKRDYGMALWWLRPAAEQANPEALTFLANMYELGQGVPRDLARALELYRNAALLGHHVAQTKLGLMHYDGSAGEQDYREALWWFMEAAEGGEALAHGLIALMYMDGSGVRADAEEAYVWVVVGLALNHWGEDTRCYERLQQIRDQLAAELNRFQFAKAMRRAEITLSERQEKMSTLRDIYSAC